MTTARPDVGKAGTTQVSFVCQRCHQPLRLDHSLMAMDKTTYAELHAPLTSITDVEDNVDAISSNQGVGSVTNDEGISKKVVPGARYLSSDSGNDFTLLGDAEPGQHESLSRKLKVISELFDFLSDQCEVDHPLCEECTDTLLDLMDQQLKLTEDECRDYRDFLEKLGSSKDDFDEVALNEELKQLELEEKTLQQHVTSIENERTLVAEQIKHEQEEGKHLNEEEQKYWKEYNEYKRKLLEYEDQQRSVDNQIRYAQSQLEKLKKTNVFNATFHIWHSGQFGTINNFRLGRLPSVTVEWNEINAAWGQTVLLLHSLAKKMNLTFERYRLVPYGSHSYLESLTDKSKELPLYGSGGFRFFWDTKFDQAMVAFLDCLQQFKEELEKGDTTFCLPYKMEKGRIEDSSSGTSYSIKIQFNSEEQWTKALKFMLTNLKWGLAWVSSQFANK